MHSPSRHPTDCGGATPVVGSSSLVDAPTLRLERVEWDSKSRCREGERETDRQVAGGRKQDGALQRDSSRPLSTAMVRPATPGTVVVLAATIVL